MSISFVYRPWKSKHNLRGGVSDDRKVLEETFGTFPVQLNETALSMLYAMGKASNNTLYIEIAEAIEIHGGITLDAEY